MFALCAIHEAFRNANIFFNVRIYKIGPLFHRYNHKVTNNGMLVYAYEVSVPVEFQIQTAVEFHLIAVAFLVYFNNEFSGGKLHC